MTYGNGTFTRAYFDTALPIDSSSIPLELVGPESLAESAAIDETNGNTGTTEHIVERTRAGQRRSSGSIRIAASPTSLTAIMPHILGGEGLNAGDLADVAPEFVLMIDRGEDVFTYAGCVISRAVFSGASGGLVYVDLDIEAETETGGGTAPVVATPTDSPWRFEDGVLTLQSSTREFSEFSLTIENQLDTERFENNLTRQYIPLLDRIITLATNHPWSTANTDLIKQDLAGAGGSLVLTNADVTDNVLTFTMGAIQYPSRSPVSAKGSMTRLPLEGFVRKTGSTASLAMSIATA